MEKIYRDFEKKRTEIINSPEFKDKELGSEKEKEILREVVSEQIEAVQVVSSPNQQTNDQDAKEIKDQPRERQVQYLVNLAIEKGISEAVNVAKGLDNAYLIDELHDALVDSLYNQLVKEGKLKEL